VVCATGVCVACRPVANLSPVAVRGVSRNEIENETETVLDGPRRRTSKVTDVLGGAGTAVVVKSRFGNARTGTRNERTRIGMFDYVRVRKREPNLCRDKRACTTNSDARSSTSHAISSTPGGGQL